MSAMICRRRPACSTPMCALGARDGNHLESTHAYTTICVFCLLFLYLTHGNVCIMLLLVIHMQKNLKLNSAFTKQSIPHLVLYIVSR